MLNRIRALFQENDPGDDRHRLEAAAAALLVEAARTDNTISQAERERILDVTRRDRKSVV